VTTDGTEGVRLGCGCEARIGCVKHATALAPVDAPDERNESRNLRTSIGAGRMEDRVSPETIEDTENNCHKRIGKVQV